MVEAGVLQVANPNALPDGGNLSVGANAASLFGLVQAASAAAVPTAAMQSSAAVVSAAPPVDSDVAASITSNRTVVVGVALAAPVSDSAVTKLSPMLPAQVESHVRIPAARAASAAMSPAAIDAVFTSHGSGGRARAYPRHAGMASGERKCLVCIRRESERRPEDRSPGRRSCPIWSLTQ